MKTIPLALAVISLTAACFILAVFMLAFQWTGQACLHLGRGIETAIRVLSELSRRLIEKGLDSEK